MFDQDSRLVAQIGEGGQAAEEAFITLDTKYRSIMHAILLNKYSIKDPSIREDIIQDTFISIFKNYQNFRGDSSVKTWFFSILKNNAYSYFRKETIINKTLKEISNDPMPANNHPPNSDEYDCEKRAIDAFRKQNIDHYSQLMQIVWNGLTLKQLADLEKIKYGAARQRISALRKKLKAFIEQLCSD